MHSDGVCVYHYNILVHSMGSRKQRGNFPSSSLLFSSCSFSLRSIFSFFCFLPPWFCIFFCPLFARSFFFICPFFAQAPFLIPLSRIFNPIAESVFAGALFLSSIEAREFFLAVENGSRDVGEGQYADTQHDFRSQFS